MDFGGILSQAWRILWKHKSLWIFGILAGCGGVGASSGNSAANTPNLEFNYNYPGDFSNLPPWLQQFLTTLSENPGLIVGLSLLAFLVVAIITLISLMGRIGLIKGTQMIDQGVERLSFSEVWSASTPYFWRILGLALLIALLYFLGGIIFLVAFIGVTVVTIGIGLLCLLPLLCLLVPVLAFLNVIIEQAYVAVVVDNVGVMEGLRRGWDVVMGNFWNYVLMGLILGIGVGLVGGMLVGLPVFVASLPLITLFVSSGERAMNAGLLVAGLLLLCALPVSLFLNGLLQTFTHSAWTLTYLRTRKSPGGAIVFSSPVEPLVPFEPARATEPVPPAEMPAVTEEDSPDEPLPPAL